MAPEKQLNNDVYVVSSCIMDIYARMPACFVLNSKSKQKFRIFVFFSVQRFVFEWNNLTVKVC